MGDKGWKAFERRVARIFGGERRGADFGDARGGKTDVIHDHFAIECKLLARPTYQQMLDACLQAEAASEPLQEPVAVVKRKRQGSPDGDALVVMRLETFAAWRLSDGD